MVGLMGATLKCVFHVAKGAYVHVEEADYTHVEKGNRDQWWDMSGRKSPGCFTGDAKDYWGERARREEPL